MKSTHPLFIVFVLFVLVFFACTKLEEPYTKVIPRVSKDTVIDWDTVTKVRRVLLEDYTGHKCVNCPEASILAASLEAQYEGKLHVLAVHAGVFAIPSSTGDYTLNLSNPTSEAWYTSFGITSNPNGMVNRKFFNGAQILVPDKWLASIEEIINTAQDAELLIINQYNASSRKLNLTVFSHFLNNLSGSYNLTVCIVEDSLIGAQKNNNPSVGPSPDWLNYVFMDVMRGSVNGNNGELLTTAVNTGTTYMKKFIVTLNSAWTPKNCHVLAFISNSETKEIIQVEKKRIIYP